MYLVICPGTHVAYDHGQTDDGADENAGAAKAGTEVVSAGAGAGRARPTGRRRPRRIARSSCEPRTCGVAVMTVGGECVALRPRLLDGDPPATTKGQEDPMKRAVTLAAAVLGSLLGIPQNGDWCGWVCDVLGDYWACRR